MKKSMMHAVLIGCLGALLMFLLVFVLEMKFIYPLALPMLIILAVGLSNAVVAFKLSVGLSARGVVSRALQTTVLSTFITNLPILGSAGYLWFLRIQQPGRINIQTAHINYYRDAPEVAFDVFVFLLLIGFALSMTVSIAAHYFTSRRIAQTLTEKMP